MAEFDPGSVKVSPSGQIQAKEPLDKEPPPFEGQHEIERRIAEWLGWTDIRWENVARWGWDMWGTPKKVGAYQPMRTHIPTYDGVYRHEHAFAMEEAVAKAGLCAEYVNGLIDVFFTCGPGLVSSDPTALYWWIAHASPMDRAKAMILVLDKKG